MPAYAVFSEVICVSGYISVFNEQYITSEYHIKIVFSALLLKSITDQPTNAIFLITEKTAILPRMTVFYIYGLHLLHEAYPFEMHDSLVQSTASLFLSAISSTDGQVGR